MLIFLETMFQMEMRQLIDLITALEDEVDLSKFSLKNYPQIVIYKITYYPFYLSVALAMYMFHIPQFYPSGTQTIEPYTLAKSIIISLGDCFQIQDDYLNLSGMPKQISIDIIDNKFSWCSEYCAGSVYARAAEGP
ncbi:hypothetical protein ARMGADRAFT_1123772 [Armillaria gallica]|uniref:(2E,6E)-farnesyl diphosphate synthase n=1 Tax=Armillaria gallica TaxID=47427 RepID=A0A2H3CUP1_ARMGA|nr:hypothetical protein ARMGADRAFT_1123772 [Armillaria gallica]